MNENTVLGIDVAKDKEDVVLVQGDKTRAGTFGNTPTGHRKLWQWLKKHKATPCRACMEATGAYSEGLAMFLHEHDVKVSVVNPARVKGFRQSELGRTKTDEADAALIARFCLAMKPTLWEPPHPHIRQLQALVRRLRSLTSMRQQEVNRLQVAHTSLREDIGACLAFFDERIAKLKQAIKQHIHQHADLSGKQKLLESIPGVGEATVGWVLAFLGEPEKFSSARQVAAFVGLNPRHRQSGTSLHGRSRLSKVGSSMVRQAFFFPAMVARQHNPILRTFANRLKRAGKGEMVILGAVMRKLVHMIYGVLKSSQPFSANICS